MALQRTRINPAFPLIWEDLRTLRIGFDTVQARIVDPTAAGQRLLSRLQRGIAEHTLSTVAAETGCTPSERDQIQYDCAAVLVTELNEETSNTYGVVNPQGSPAARRKRYPRLNSTIAKPRNTTIAVIGSSKTRERILRACEFRNFEPHPAASFPDLRSKEFPRPDLVIIVERFWAPPAALQCLVVLGFPHISIRFSDQSVVVGPLVIPNITPCGMCMQITDSHRDPLLPVLAAQLLQTVPVTETPIVTDFAATIACHQWFSHVSAKAAGVTPHFETFRYPVQAGILHPAPAVTQYSFAEQCSCNTSLHEKHSVQPPPEQHSKANNS